MASNPLAPPLSDPPRDEIVRAAQRVEEFFRDDMIRGAMDRLEHDYIEALIAAETSEARAKAQGRVKALRDLFEMLKKMKDAGEFVLLMVEAEKKRHEFQKSEGLVS